MMCKFFDILLDLDGQIYIYICISMMTVMYQIYERATATYELMRKGNAWTSRRLLERVNSLWGPSGDTRQSDIHGEIYFSPERSIFISCLHCGNIHNICLKSRTVLPLEWQMGYRSLQHHICHKQSGAVITRSNKTWYYTWHGIDCGIALIRG